MKSKIFAVLEILLTYLVLRLLGIALRSTGVVQWEQETLGWSYTSEILFIAIPALVIWLARREWSDYGVSLADWPTNLDIGIKAYLVRIISVGVLVAALMFGIGYTSFKGGLLISIGEVFAIALMVWILQRQKTVASGKSNLVITGLLLLFPILVGLAMSRLTLIVVSTVVWQFFSGFGEEFVFRGYIQSRLNQAFGRPFHWFGIQFGAGLIVTFLLFGFFHAFNTYDPAIGLSSLSWGWALFTTFGGLFFGILREKTGSLVAPGIAHGLPDAVGEALGRLFGWM
ncbi:MAG: CPBP family intramembrane metalloprotease [Anaerolineaceae bacterium]|nr:MAG: CPBP family intramembrane metalloprotease [Anaerolineaceae bacterium]